MLSSVVHLLQTHNTEARPSQADTLLQESSTAEAVKTVTDLVLAKEGVSVPCPVHVLVPVQDQPDGPAQQPSRHSCSSIAEDAAGLLASKAPSNALHVAHHLVLGNAQDVGNRALVLSRGLHSTILSHLPSATFVLMSSLVFATWL